MHALKESKSPPSPFEDVQSRDNGLTSWACKIYLLGSENYFSTLLKMKEKALKRDTKRNEK